MAALPKEVRDALAPAIEQGANEISTLQRRLAPKRSGALARSIRVVKGSYTPENSNVRGISSGPLKGDADLTFYLVAGDATAWYARLVEFGTAPHENSGIYDGSEHPGAKPRPFFYPAYRAMRRRVRARITRETKKAFRKAAGR